MVRGGGKSSDRGFVLPLALIVLALLSALSLGMTKSVRQELRDVTLQKRLFDAEIRMRSAAQWAIYVLLTGQDRKDRVVSGEIELPINGEPVRWRGVELRVQDDAGLFPLAIYDPGKFARLLSMLTDKLRAQRLAAVLNDWIDPDSIRSLHGAELADYRADGLSMLPRNAPIRSLDELLEVPGFDRQLFNGTAERPGLRDLVTAGGSDSFNLATAPPEVVVAMLGGRQAHMDRLLALRAHHQWRELEQLVRNHPLFLDAYPFQRGFRYWLRLQVDGIRARMGVSLDPEARVPFALMLWQYPDHDRG